MAEEKTKEKEERERRNKDLVRRMKKGENLTAYNTQDTWFPNRPLIKKDKELIKKLYNEETKGKIALKKVEDEND